MSSKFVSGFALLALLCPAASAFAAAPPAAAGKTAATGATVSPAAALARAAAKYSCTINPAAPPKGDAFQVTQYSLKLVSGSPPANKQIKVALGIQPTGQALPSACTSGLKNGALTMGSVIMAPPVMDPDYIWVCNAVQSNETCEAANPNVPR